MLTVKLYKSHTMKIVEAEEVNIYPAGSPEPIPTPLGSEPMSLPTNTVREISVITHTGKQQAFYVSHYPRPDNFALEVEFYDHAYIENAHGATTETVRAY